MTVHELANTIFSPSLIGRVVYIPARSAVRTLSDVGPFITSDTGSILSPIGYGGSIRHKPVPIWGILEGHKSGEIVITSLRLRGSRSYRIVYPQQVQLLSPIEELSLQGRKDLKWP